MRVPLELKQFETHGRQHEGLAGHALRAKRAMELLAALGPLQGLDILMERIKAPDSERTFSVRSRNLRHPFTMTASHGDIGMFLGSVIHEVYQVPPELTKIVDRHAIFDIGANIGASSAYFASKYPRSTIVAIEPHARNIRLLEKNLEPYPTTETVVIDKALSTNAGTAYLQNAEITGTGKHGSYRFGSDVPTEINEIVPAITPRELLPNTAPTGRIGIMKLNIEGAEKELFSANHMDSLLHLTNIMLVQTHDHYVPGCSETVRQAAERCNLRLIDQTGDLAFYLSQTALETLFEA